MLNKNKHIAILQIFLIVVGIVAISHSIGSVGAVTVEGERTTSPTLEVAQPRQVRPEQVIVSAAPIAAKVSKIDIKNLIGGVGDAGDVAYTLKDWPGYEFFVKDGGWVVKNSAGEIAAVNSQDALGQLGTNFPDAIKGTGKPPIEAAKFGLKKLLGNALTALAIYGAIYFVGNLIAPEQQAAINSVAGAVSAGYFVGTTAADLGLSGGLIGATGLGIIVGVGILIATFNVKDQKQVNFQCLPWQAPTGGNDCEKCGKDGLPCTEYQCQSLGQACQLVNEGTAEQGCIWLNRNDVKPPVIQPWNDVLLSDKYTYNPDSTVSPPDRGVFVRYDHGCIPAFTSFQFGIKLDERATCKIDNQRTRNISEMQWFFGGDNLLKYNHTQIMPTASKESLEAENISAENGGNFNLYVRCQDANGNANTANFVFKYCVDQGPDTTPPIIIGTNFDALEEVPIGFNQTTLDVLLYTNEPADCKWAHDRDLDYEQMTGTMKCSKSVLELNAQMVYTCSTTLDSIKSRQKNDFYFRCKDKPLAKPEDRNVNSEGFKFTVAGTQPLVIDEVGPVGTIRDSTATAKVTLTAETSAGYKEGAAACYFSSTGNADDYVKFLETDSHTHKQDLYLASGTYNYFIKCIDLGGNQDQKEITFTVETDSTEPEIVRAYHEDNYLTVVTNEPGKCVYSLQGCSYLFGDGVEMNSFGGVENSVEWSTDRTYYIKCEDEYHNQPDPNVCTIIVRPFDFFEKAE